MKATDRRCVGDGRVHLTALGLGCSSLAGLYTATSEAEANAVLQATWDAGLRYFDTAPFYGYTLGERRVGSFLATRPRDEFVVSTKVGRVMQPDVGVAPGDDGWAEPLPFRPAYDYTRAGVLRSVEDSLQRMGLSRIDILFVHDIGRRTHGDRHDHYWRQLTRGGGLRALEELRLEGRVAAIGLGVNEWQVARDAMEETQIDCTLLAGRYTLLEQASSSTFMDDCVRHRSRVVIGGVFNSGILAGHARFDYADAPADVVAKVHALQSVCAEFGVALPAAALQFPMAHPAVAACVVGVRSASELHQDIAWFQQAIPAALWNALRDRGLLPAHAPCPDDNDRTAG